MRSPLLLLLGTALAVPAPRGNDALDATLWGGPQGAVYDMPLTWGPSGFTTTISFGTPKQELTAFVDWTWVSTIVISNRCEMAEYNLSTCFFPQQITWNANTSTTLLDLSGEYEDYTWRPNHFLFNYPLHVTIAADEMQVGPIERETVVQLSDLTFDAEILGQVFPFSAIFGLSPVFDGDGLDYQSPIYQQWKQGAWKNPLAGFVFCHNNATRESTCQGHDAIQTLGGLRSDLIKDDQVWWYDVHTYVDVNSLDFVYDPPVWNYWAVELSSLRIGDEEQAIEPTSNTSGKAAIFDHASYGRGAPLTQNAYARLVDITGAKAVKLDEPPNNGEQAFYAVECDKAASFPVLRYTFVGQDRVWEIVPANYVATMPDGSCVLNVRALSTGDKFIGNFGETFAIDKYISLDWETLRVGISDIEWPGESCPS